MTLIPKDKFKPIEIFYSSFCAEMGWRAGTICFSIVVLVLESGGSACLVVMAPEYVVNGGGD